MNVEVVGSSGGNHFLVLKDLAMGEWIIVLDDSASLSGFSSLCHDKKRGISFVIALQTFE